MHGMDGWMVRKTMLGLMNGCRHRCMDGWIANESAGMNETQQVWMKWRDLLSRQDEKTFLSFSRPQKYIFLIFKVFYVSNGKKCLLASFFSVSDAIFFLWFYGFHGNATATPFCLMHLLITIIGIWSESRSSGVHVC